MLRSLIRAIKLTRRSQNLVTIQAEEMLIYIVVVEVANFHPCPPTVLLIHQTLVEAIHSSTKVFTVGTRERHIRNPESRNH